MFSSFKNLNRLLAWGHARTIGTLAPARPDCPRTLSDQFARPEVLQRALKEKSLTIQLEQRTKGESDTAVAAGGIKLPLGASDAVIQAARDLVARDGLEILAKVAKLHFKTTHAVLGTSPSDAAD